MTTYFHSLIQAKSGEVKLLLWTLLVKWCGHAVNSGMIFVSYLTDFSYFPLSEIAESCRTQSEQVKNVKRGCRWFQLFFIDFQLFYFLARIISVNFNIQKHFIFISVLLPISIYWRHCLDWVQDFSNILIQVPNQNGKTR
jgi:hypothetical protein